MILKEALDFVRKEVKHHWEGCTAVITHLGNACYAGWQRQLS